MKILTSAASRVVIEERKEGKINNGKWRTDTNARL